MKKLLMLVAVVLGTTVMVNAQTTPAKETAAKEVKTAKHMKKAKVESVKADTKTATTTVTAKAAPVKAETTKQTKVTIKK